MDQQGTAGISLAATGIRVAYGPREVLHGVDIALQPGKVHALLGANGSGKSTFVKVLTGRMQSTAGQLRVGDRSPAPLRSPGEAYAIGIRAVQQETPLIDTMSITENFALRTGYPTGLLGRVLWRAAHDRTRALLARLGLDLDPTARAATVSAADRGLLTIGIALDDGSETATTAGKILVLDEATAAIPEKEAFAVMQRVRKLADEGLTVLMVTHRISETTEFADDMTVIYDGDIAYQGTAKVEPDRIIELIVTGNADAGAAPDKKSSPQSRVPSGKRMVSVDGLTGGGLNGVSFNIDAGEILGIVGGPQSGAEVLPLALAGLAPKVEGSITLDGKSGPLPRGPQRAIERGICLVPRDRLRQGGVGILSVFENVLLPTARGFVFNSAKNRGLVDSVIDEFAVVPPSPQHRLNQLSGGNQQKVIVGKWLGRRPKLLILDDPTIGVDPGARRTMFNVIAERCRAEGLCVLLFSSEPEELAQHCHRLLAIEDGRIVAELVGDQLDRLTVSALASR